MDGTLVNSLHDLAESANNTMEHFGYHTHSVSDYKYMIGDGVNELIRRALPEYACNDVDMISANLYFKNEYSNNYNKNTIPYDGIIKVIKQLKSMNIRLAVATNKPDEFAKKIISELFGNNFDLVCGFTEKKPKKPNPEIVFGILSGLGVCAEEAVFIGDSGVDIQTAKNSGLKSIGCLWGFRTKEELISEGADFIINAPADILRIIEKENKFER